MIKQRRADFTDFNPTILGILLLLVFFPIGILFLILSSSMSGQAKAIISVVVLIVGFVSLLMLGVAFSQVGSSNSRPNNYQETTQTKAEKERLRNLRNELTISFYSRPKCDNNILFLWNYLIVKNCNLVEPPKDFSRFLEGPEEYNCMNAFPGACHR